MKPIIGVMPLVDVERESLWMLPDYLDGIRQAGGLPVMLPLTEDSRELEELVKLCGGLLFTGGQDVAPELYGETAAGDFVAGCPERDRMEQKALKLALSMDRAVMGICRGIQLINVTMGGTLYQDLPSQHPSAIAHRQAQPHTVPSHTVRLLEGTPLYNLLQKGELAVNSSHHQAVRELAPGLKAMAISPDGLIESLYGPERKFLWAVQWHPERLCRTDADSRAIFSAFVKAAG